MGCSESVPHKKDAFVPATRGSTGRTAGKALPQPSRKGADKKDASPPSHQAARPPSAEAAGSRRNSRAVTTAPNAVKGNEPRHRGTPSVPDEHLSGRSTKTPANGRSASGATHHRENFSAPPSAAESRRGSVRESEGGKKARRGKGDRQVQAQPHHPTHGPVAAGGFRSIDAQRLPCNGYGGADAHAASHQRPDPRPVVPPLPLSQIFSQRRKADEETTRAVLLPPAAAAAAGVSTNEPFAHHNAYHNAPYTNAPYGGHRHHQHHNDVYAPSPYDDGHYGHHHHMHNAHYTGHHRYMYDQHCMDPNARRSVDEGHCGLPATTPMRMAPHVSNGAADGSSVPHAFMASASHLPARELQSAESAAADAEGGCGCCHTVPAVAAPEMPVPTELPCTSRAAVSPRVIDSCVVSTADSDSDSESDVSEASGGEGSAEEGYAKVKVNEAAEEGAADSSEEEEEGGVEGEEAEEEEEEEEEEVRADHLPALVPLRHKSWRSEPERIGIYYSANPLKDLGAYSVYRRSRSTLGIPFPAPAPVSVPPQREKSASPSTPRPPIRSAPQFSSAHG